MSAEDGGQAFPRTYAYMNPRAGQSELRSVEGMSLRDYFAAKALGSLIEHAPTREGRVHPDASMDLLAKNAYALADAMLSERSK